STSRILEARINQHFQDTSVARAFDEGLLQLFTPVSFGEDWEHFLGVATHLYIPNSTGFNIATAKRLVDEAHKPAAPLLDISYAWEGIGPDAVAIIAPVMNDPAPEIAFAAARAAAFIGDSSAIQVLTQMAQNSHNPFQLAAVQTLGEMPDSPEINQILRTLINNEETLVRVEAYRILAGRQDTSIYTRLVPGNEPATAKFVLDIVPSTGKPLIYATRRGVPRIAVIGGKPALSLPVLFTAFKNRLSISTAPNGRQLTIYYRGPQTPTAINVKSEPDIAELIARLGGDGPVDQANLNFSYCDIVAMLQKLADSQQITAYASATDPTPAPTPFILQPLSNNTQQIDEAPLIPEKSRDQTDTPTSLPSATTLPSDQIGAAPTGTMDRQ
ncbi:MAG: HEAT repeat domain-containing protein, partial [Phycisphaerae bacterium]|nr:HEAT repeat domain-containing protein [Phycisphaerae bacterium]